ncbi:hypothetical protein OIE49_25590 [Streptomyces sp. NBC_01788]|uniref:hypothetical protein n=1 Tax=Streptomyces sp. NBC_01788 TaxID=2975940 RepID=UPI002DD8DAA4|nr:hypothetical protein [Streptomyces sp. NBC_01788]WSB29000.1 hypothetical protein OIE49_25590 [Streptomyces sp. NBC_01788]
MNTRTIAVIAAVLLAGLAGCGTGADAEVNRSTTDIRTSVEHLREAIGEETKAVKGERGDVRAQAENVRLVARIESTNLTKYASRAPAETQHFANAAKSWAESVATAREAMLSDQETSAIALANSITEERFMDSAATDLHVTPWTPRPPWTPSPEADSE